MDDKPKYDPQKHHRRSIRLRDYDYKQAGAYFITICLQDKECLFGEITDGLMHLNDAGVMIDKWWQKIPEKFPDIELGDYQIMPNHFHAIVINVGADPCVRPTQSDKDDKLINTESTTVGADPHVCPDERISNGGSCIEIENGHISLEDQLAPEGGEHMGSPLHTVVQWFKTMSTNEYIRNVKQNDWPAFNGKLWQRNYFEHIIRDPKSFQHIAKYIYDNPANWETDKLFIK